MTDFVGPPLFTREGPQFYDAAFAHNQPFAVAGPYQTVLGTLDELEFRGWVTTNNVPFSPDEHPTDYDMRGYWLDVGKPGSWSGGHFPDKFKAPYDTSFSAESKYAKPDCPFKWHGDLLIDERNNQIVFGPPGAGVKTKDKPAPRKSKDIGKTHLQLSKLDLQLEAMGETLLNSFALAVKGQKSAQIIERVLSADIERTIEGASTLTVVVNDYDRQLLKSGRLATGTDTEIDGLWFRLVKVSKQDDHLTLIFEDREVAILRTYNEPRHWPWNKGSRCEFAHALVAEVTEFAIPFFCESDAADIKKVDATPVPPETAQQRRTTGGFAPGVRITVQGQVASSSQRDIINRVLRVGHDMGVRRKLLVAAIMTATLESGCQNLTCEQGPGLALGWCYRAIARGPIGVFQQFTDWDESQAIPGPPGDVERDAKFFFTQMLECEKTHNGQQSHERLANCAQNTGGSHEKTRSEIPYGRYLTEAEHTVSQWGIVGGDTTSQDAAAQSNTQSGWHPSIGGGEFQFTRGTPIKDQSGRLRWRKENTWDCLGRLADELQWRRFAVSGSIYMLSEPTLFSSQPRMRIAEHQDGVDVVNADYDTGKRNAAVTVSGRIHRWQAPPGSVVEIYDLGVLDGRWLVSAVRRSLFRTDAEIDLVKPRPALPEPKASQSVFGFSTGESPGAVSPTAKPATGGVGDYVFPIPKSYGPYSDEGTDMGWDMRVATHVGDPLLAIGGGAIVDLRAMHSYGTFGPYYIVLKLDQPIDRLGLNPPVQGGGIAIYYGHCGIPYVGIGDHVNTADKLTRVQGYGGDDPNFLPGHMEIGWAADEGNGTWTMLAVKNGTSGGGIQGNQNLPEGIAFREWLIKQKRVNVGYTGKPVSYRDEVVRWARSGIGKPTYALFGADGRDNHGNFPSFYTKKGQWPDESDCAYYVTLAYMWGTDATKDPNGLHFDGSFTGNMWQGPAGRTVGEAGAVANAKKGDLALWNPESNPDGHVVMFAEDYHGDSTKILEHRGGHTPEERTYGERTSDIGAPGYVRSFL